MENEIQYYKITLILKDYDIADLYIKFRVMPNEVAQKFLETKTRFLADFNSNNELIEVDLNLEDRKILTNKQLRKIMQKFESRNELECVTYRIFDNHNYRVPRLVSSYLKEIE